MKYRLNWPEPKIHTCPWLKLNQRQKTSGTRGHLMRKSCIFSLGLFFSVPPLIQPTENVLFTEPQFYRTVRWEYRSHVQLDEMAKRIKSAISTFHNPAKVSRSCTLSHAAPRTPLSGWGARATEGVEARCSASFLVSQVPKAADHHHHIWAAAAGNPLCPGPA